MSKPPPRLYVDAPLAADALVETDAAAAHYLQSVLRLGIGDSVLLFNGRQGEWRGVLSQTGRNGVLLRLLNMTRPQPVVANGPWLCFALLKRTATDLLMRKAVELGAARLLPVITARTNVHELNPARAEAMAREAAEQCNRLDKPQIDAPRPLQALLDDWPPDRTLYVCAEAGPATPAAEAFGRHRDRAGGGVALLTGPEGGFTDAELQDLGGRGFVVPVGLGPRLLRAETASLAALACWQSVAGDGAARP